jgi:hypothetical protein
VAGQGKLANDLRTGLVVDMPSNHDDIAPKELSFLDEVWEKKSVRRHIFEFGCLFGAIGLGISVYHWWDGAPISRVILGAFTSILFTGLSAATPKLIWPLWRGWMGLAKVLNMVMTPVILGILWFCVLAPTAIILRLIGKRVMDLSFRADVPTYWIDRPAKTNDFKRLERQF